jgi:cytochrome c2
VISSGHRNPQGLALRDNGEVLETEHGPQGGDELNVIREGRNYGWPFETLGVQYGGQDWPLAEKRGRHDSYEMPLFAWLPSIGISQLIQLQNFDPVWDGDILVNSMAIHTLYRLRPEGDRILYSEALVMKDRLRDIIQDAAGRVIILTDSYKVIAIEPAADRFSLILAEAPENVRRTITACLECHTLSPNGGQAGRIPLAGIVGRDIASWPGVEYSEELSSQSGRWDRERLDAFLMDPSALTPNSAMAGMAVEDADARRGLIDLLEQLSVE